VDIAKSINAHGAHVGMDDLPYNQARKILGRKSIIGFIKVKKLKGVDYIGVSAFSSNTKKEMKNYFGLSGLKICAKATKIPLIAIGGINISDVNSILKLKIHGVAMISSLLKGNIKKNCMDVSKIISSYEKI
jgi:thiamine-phosphate pyrophosphorylase